MNRRGFLKLLGAAVTLSAGGIALLEAEPIIKTYFLPPRCGWNAGSWELAVATEALRIVDGKIEMEGMGERAGYHNEFLVINGYRQAQLDSLLARRARLVERCDKLARGWTPHYTQHSTRRADGTIRTMRIHGGRS